MTEPLRGQNLILFFREFTNNNPEWGSIFGVLADIFVFSYPILLLSVYLYGIIKKQKTEKMAALYIFGSTVLATIINIAIQLTNNKQRPIIEFGWEEACPETILHKILPTASFPSDHAAVSFAIAAAVFLRGRKQKQPFYKRLSIPFWIFAVVMSSARVVTSVHWPTDIIAGALIGILAAVISSQSNIFNRLKTWIYSPLIKVEEWITRRFM